MSNQELTQEDKDFCTYAYIAEACKVVSCILDMDSEKELADKMNEYCTTYTHNGQRYLIYNGNGFGASGFGYAILDES